MVSLTFIAFQHKESDEQAKEFVERLKNQTSQDFKVLIVKETINNWNEDWGQTSKYEACKTVKTEYVCFPNVDSFYDDAFVEKMVAKAKETNADLVYCDFNNPKPQKAKPLTCHIDVGGFIVKPKIVLADGWVDRSKLGDGKMVERIGNPDKGRLLVKVKEDLYSKR